MIRNSIVSHLDNNNLITESQHGFRNVTLCLTNFGLLEFLEEVVSHVDKGIPVDVTPHKRLMEKIRAELHGYKSGYAIGNREYSGVWCLFKLGAGLERSTTEFCFRISYVLDVHK